MKGPVLFLTYRMAKGYGVDVVVWNYLKQFEARGIRCVVGCLDTDGHYGLSKVRFAPSEAGALREFAKSLGATTLIAHTPPFYESVAQLAGEFNAWIWEHGDPTPELIHGEAAVRRRAIEEKRSLYPQVRGVVAISRFIHDELKFPPALVIPSGCDHVRASTEPKAAPRGRKLRVGTLMRLGSREHAYKGGDDFIDFCTELDRLRFDISVMGRGNLHDAETFRRRGVTVHLNATDAEKETYLRNLDVFVTFSRWEGFNLPLVEAQALGTVGLARQGSVHAEVSPFLFADAHAAAGQVQALAQNPERLLRDSRTSQDFVLSRYRWSRAADQAIRALDLEGDGQAQDIHDGLALTDTWKLLGRPRSFLSVTKNLLFRKQAQVLPPL